MIGATLTTRLAQDGIEKSAVTMFALTFLAYNFKFLWAPLVDSVRIPLLGRFGQRRSWLWLTGVLRDGRGRVPRHRRSRSSRCHRRSRGRPRRRRRRDVRHRHRRLSHRAARAAPARRRLRHVAVRLAHRRRRRRVRSRSSRGARRAGPRPTSPARVFALPAMLVGVVDGRAGAAPRAGRAARRRRRRGRLFQPACRVPQARRARWSSCSSC